MADEDRGAGAVPDRHVPRHIRGTPSIFAAWSLDANLDKADLLVNEIGPRAGADVVPSWTDYLDVVADGEWTVNFR